MSSPESPHPAKAIDAGASLTATVPADSSIAPSRADRKTFVLSEIFAWDGDQLTVTSDEAMAVLTRPALSPSTSKAMHGCVARWAVERVISEPPNPFSASEVGTSGHAILEDLFALPAFGRTRAAANKILEAHKIQAWPGHDEATASKRSDWHTAVHNAISGLWSIEDPRKVEVAGLEQGFEDTYVCDIPFVGYIDRLDWVTDPETGQKVIRVVDYKTGKVPKDIGRFGDDHGDQMRLYREALRSKTGVAPLKATLLYTQHGKFRDVPLSKPAMSKTLRAFRQSWDDLNTYTERAAYPTQDGPLCGWCPAVNSCPVAASNERVDRTGLARSAEFLGIPVVRSLPPRPEPDERAARYATPTEHPYEPTDDFGSAAMAPAPIPVGYDPAAASVHSAPGAAHVLIDPAHPEGNNPMTAAAPRFSEDKSWFEESNGVLNANSYSARAVFATTSMAYEEMNKAGVAMTKDGIDALARTLLFVVATVHSEYSATTPSLMDGLRTRLQGLLHSYMDSHPLPWGGDKAAWDAWVGLGVKHVRSMTAAAQRLYIEGPGVEPWNALAVTAAPLQTAPQTAPQMATA
ncbi:RecB family exonuclease [Nocardioides sp. Leaf285]|uniref:RecB family exonuclease n=1 Tax=Nocardioides sp. Leaf285 TaxID=1736322 RepID=UPI000702C719|nr:PD-(D/E)XK nuclease family protein [Nocardioides sp. Leaf285]KQP63012.1 hypothetical protein ASF47_18545 [Nocardioides sp. Leaf285]